MAEETVVKMTRGLLGFEEITEYLFKPVPDNPFFFWLESENGPEFLLTRPDFFFPEYRIELPRESIKELLGEGSVEVYTIVTVPENTVDMTANLLAPVFINKKEGLARQVVLNNTDYTTRHYLFPPEKRRDCG